MGAAETPILRYMGKLLNRMYEVGFRPTDPLMGGVEKAHDAVHHLSVMLHYEGCEKERWPLDRLDFSWAHYGESCVAILSWS
jgi:hypothetical protein